MLLKKNIRAAPTAVTIFHNCGYRLLSPTVSVAANGFSVSFASFGVTIFSSCTLLSPTVLFLSFLLKRFSLTYTNSNRLHFPNKIILHVFESGDIVIYHPMLTVGYCVLTFYMFVWSMCTCMNQNLFYNAKEKYNEKNTFKSYTFCLCSASF